MAACSRRQSRAFHRRARSAALGRWRSKLASVWSTPFRLCSKPTNSSNRNPQPDLLHLSPTLDLYLTICWLLPWKDKGHLMLAFLTIISFPSVHSCIPSHAKPGADLRQGRPQLCVVQRPIPIQNIPVGQVNEGYKQPTNLLLLGATKALFFWRNGKNLFQRYSNKNITGLLFQSESLGVVRFGEVWTESMQWTIHRRFQAVEKGDFYNCHRIKIWSKIQILMAWWC
uniref:Uncharacterized protein n=1 Tax=Oryza rufipogon TaxID=4529 RepID=A0A0E0Q899_ORYRU